MLPLERKKILSIYGPVHWNQAQCDQYIVISYK